jgi:hypoxanthine-DNA glycosylase
MDRSQGTPFIEEKVQMIHGFAPIAAYNAKVLVLGTIPGRQSLAKGQYYANPQNAFWFIMEGLFHGEGPSPDYEGRTRLLKSAGVALWDVLLAAERERSVDSSIVPGTEVANDFQNFFSRHKQIRNLFFNGARAEALFRRFALPYLPQLMPLSMIRLPSTSPANARLTKTEKLTAWRIVADVLKRP